MTQKRFASVNTASIDAFAYTPPAQVHNAARILIKPNLAARPESPGVVSLDVLGAVLRGLRRAAPVARLVIVENAAGQNAVQQIFQETGIDTLLDQEMRVADVGQMVMTTYAAAATVFTAPEAVKDYDCVISVAALETPVLTPSLHNWLGLLPHALYPMREHLTTPDTLSAILEAFGTHMDGAVVAVGGRVVWGDDVQAVDAAAARLAEQRER